MRLRIAVSVTALVLALIFAQAFALLAMYEEMEEDFILGILDEQLEYSIEVSRQSNQLVLPNTPTMKLYRLREGEPAPAGLSPAIAALPIGNHELFEVEREFHVAVREAEGARYILSYDESEHEARVRAVSTAVIVGAILLGVLVLFLVHALAGRLSRGLETLAARVGQGAGGAAYARAGMERELLAVARALDVAETRQAELLARERDFNANLSHELRTPLAGIRSDAEMLAARDDVPAAVGRRALRIVAAADRITGLAESLLLLAREARPQLIEEIRLGDAVHDAWAALAVQRSDVPALDADIPASAVIQADPALLALVLRNLLDNALRHGEGRAVSCRVEGARLLVCDRGPGFGDGDPGLAFDRFHRSGANAGHGLGLALVRHICQACGWGLHAANRDGGGACVGVDFGTATGISPSRNAG